jgi:Calpain family cysteine protease
VKEIWPMIIEKAYAKMYGSYENIVSGIIQEAMVDLTNGTGASYSFDDEEI